MYRFKLLLLRSSTISDGAVCLLNRRLDEASKRLQRERRVKLHDWEERLSSIDSFLRKTERENERLEPVGDDLETVRRQLDDFEVCWFTAAIFCILTIKFTNTNERTDGRTDGRTNERTNE